ncbi:hypothetical protein [Blastopirellula marina]|uniref:Anti sigma-E protein RseA N-terminal domain-containing protein n=1 Tax=Blastopirellula marina TaxID=124 RepID=A0A2S8FFA5_9BACT|nr:hypothetical protein [Blastopirellula marina]PQO30853.1 hypothetical protein C5Y98_20910 [Blastopirellula marina]PTL42706.1 hypothetical protein C5Y97_20920 [Blastopirellula marina]
MNENERIELQRQIDLLVDGELSADQERALLSKLEHEEAWRDCALTFVENQVWRRAVPSVVDSHPVAISPAAEVPAAAPILHGARGWEGRFGQLATLAASVMIAFIAGQMIAPWMTSSDGGAGISGNSSQENSLFVNYRNGDRVDRMPIAIDESKLYDPTEPFPTSVGMSPEKLKELSDSGRTYQRKQQWLPVTLKDGRQAMVPMEEVVVDPPPTHYFP